MNESDFMKAGNDWFMNCCTEDGITSTVQEWYENDTHVAWDWDNLDKRPYYQLLKDLLVDEEVVYAIEGVDFEKEDILFFGDIMNYPIITWCGNEYSIVDYFRARNRTSRRHSLKEMRTYYDGYVKLKNR